MKILLATEMYENQINGVSCSVITLRDELRKKGHDVRILTVSNNNESCMEKTDYLIGSFSVPLYPDVRQTFKFNDPLINDIVKWHPDIVHVQTEFTMGKIGKKVARLCNVPYIHTCHTLWEDYASYVVPGKRFGNFLAKRLVKSALEGTKAVIVPTKKIENLIIKYNINVPTYIIPSGIDLDRFQKKVSSFEIMKLKSKLNIPNKAKVLISIGRLAKEKNLDEIISYMPDLIEKDKNIYLVIGGDGPHRKNLESLVKKLNLEKNVKFLGMIEPKLTYKYYQMGDVFVCASTSETQGITYIEAQACSLPLVCRYDKVLDEVIDEGNNGFMYKTKVGFIDSVLNVLYDKTLMKKMKTNSLISSKRFSKEKFSNDVEKLYNKVIEEYKGE